MLFPDADSASPLPCIASLPYGRSPIHSLRSCTSRQDVRCRGGRQMRMQAFSLGSSLAHISNRIVWRLIIICSPIMQNSVIHLSYRNLPITFPIRNPAKVTASFSQRNLFFTDASRPKSAGVPLKSHKVEQVPPCIYTGRNLLGILHPQAPASSALWS